jgi:hypothetical protein
MTEYVRHQSKNVLFTDWTYHFCFSSDVCCGTDEFRVGIAHLVSAQTPNAHLIYQHSASKPVIDNPAAIARAAHCANRK